MATRKLRLENDEEALLLLGEQDVRLKQLERDFRVEMYVRHEHTGPGVMLSVRGSPSHAEKALSRLKEMLLRIRRGEPLPTKPPPATPFAPFEEPPVPKEAVCVTMFGKAIRPRGERQKAYVEAIRSNDLVFSIGPAGTGKTFLAVACALEALGNRVVSRIFLTRPVVEAGEKLGFLPGDLYEKVHPYLKPLYDAFYVMLGPEKFRLWREDEIIEIVPLAYMRGRTLENAFIILDEAQNTTSEQMKMFLTRMGMASKIVVTGDITQIDLENKKSSGLVQVREILKQIPAANFIYFNEEDVVRHSLVKQIIRAYEKWEKKG